MIRRIWDWLIRPVDPLLLIFTSLVFLVSLVTLYSASNQNLEKVGDKFLFMCVALGGMWVIAQIKPQTLMRLAVPAYILGVLLLIGVALVGDVSHGARRWLNIGVTRIQPSELMRLALPLMLAWYFQQHEGMIRARHFVVATLLILVPVGLIIRQPDLGTGLLISASGFFILYLAGLSWRILAVMVVAGGAGAYVLTHWDLCIGVLHEYQCRRIATMLDPEEDPLGAGYHIIQGMIAIGSGGVFGKGWLHGTQTHLEFIPERTTDFIFAVFGEEFGLLGNLVLLVLYLLVIGRGLAMATNAATLFGRLLAGSITLTFFTYAFVNMGMVSGILPVVGVPLPLISYGGTSMVSILAGFGILMSISKNRVLMKG